MAKCAFVMVLFVLVLVHASAREVPGNHGGQDQETAIMPELVPVKTSGTNNNNNGMEVLLCLLDIRNVSFDTPRRCLTETRMSWQGKEGHVEAQMSVS